MPNPTKRSEMSSSHKATGEAGCRVAYLVAKRPMKLSGISAISSFKSPLLFPARWTVQNVLARLLCDSAKWSSFRKSLPKSPQPTAGRIRERSRAIIASSVASEFEARARLPRFMICDGSPDANTTPPIPTGVLSTSREPKTMQLALPSVVDLGARVSPKPGGDGRKGYAVTSHRTPARSLSESPDTDGNICICIKGSTGTFSGLKGKHMKRLLLGGRFRECLYGFKRSNGSS